VHQLLDWTANRVRGGRGAIPAWLDEGLAEYLRASLRGAPGRLAYDANAADLVAFRLQAHAKRAYGLTRLMNFDSGDFLASSRQDLKYAQAYTFVHFALHADGGRLRPRFVAFLRGAWAGQGSPTDLEKAFGAKDDAIERAWTSWVEERAR
jgi:hypothetical protein